MNEGKRKEDSKKGSIPEFLNIFKEAIAKDFQNFLFFCIIVFAPFVNPFDSDTKYNSATAISYYLSAGAYFLYSIILLFRDIKANELSKASRNLREGKKFWSLLIIGVIVGAFPPILAPLVLNFHTAQLKMVERIPDLTTQIVLIILALLLVTINNYLPQVFQISAKRAGNQLVEKEPEVEKNPRSSRNKSRVYLGFFILLFLTIYLARK